MRCLTPHDLTLTAELRPPNYFSHIEHVTLSTPAVSCHVGFPVFQRGFTSFARRGVTSFDIMAVRLGGLTVAFGIFGFVVFLLFSC